MSSAARHIVGGCVISLAALHLNLQTNNVKVEWAHECVGEGHKEYIREKVLETKWNKKSVKKTRMWREYLNKVDINPQLHMFISHFTIWY